MKIGIFGDSYCHDYDSMGAGNYSWYNVLRSYGHEVTTFGSSGSSLLWSAKKINQHYGKFDFIIWVITNPMRISIDLDESPYNIHLTTPDEKPLWAVRQLKLESSKNKLQAVDMWFKYLMDIDEQLLTSKALLHLYKNTYDNLLMVPAFYDSIYPYETDSDMFNLYDLCSKEAKHYGSDVDFLLAHDGRQCHLTIENNAILASLINDNLKPGLFQTDYNNFNMHPSADKNFYFYD